MRTFDYGEYGMIEGIDSKQGDNFHDTHGDYVLRSDVEELEQQRDELMAALKVADEWLAIEGYTEQGDVRKQILAAIAKAEK